MKKITNYGMALLAVVTVMALMNGGAVLISTAAAFGGALADGLSGMSRAYGFLMNHLNFYSVLIYLIPAAVVLPWYYFAFAQPVGAQRFFRQQTMQIYPVTFGWLILLGLAVQHATSLILTVIGIMMPSAMADYTNMMENSGMNQYSLMWAISTLVLPPLVEETVFRGLVYGYLRKAGLGFLAANLIQAVCFGIFHMNLVQGIYAAILGFLLGYLAYRYNSILVPMALHALYNLFGTALFDFESRFLPEPFIGLMIMGSVPVLIVALVMIHYRVGEKKN